MEPYVTTGDDCCDVAPDRLRENGVVKLWPVYTLDRIDELLAAACQRLRPYLAHTPDISDADRVLCAGR